MKFFNKTTIFINSYMIYTVTVKVWYRNIKWKRLSLPSVFSFFGVVGRKINLLKEQQRYQQNIFKTFSLPKRRFFVDFIKKFLKTKKTSNFPKTMFIVNSGMKWAFTGLSLTIHITHISKSPISSA